MITIKDIYLENFMSIDSLYLDFPENCLVSITGQNGGGKSTLLCALAFAFTNYRKGDSYKDYIKLHRPNAKIVINAVLKGYPINYDILIESGKTASLTRKVTYKDSVYQNSDYDQFMREHELDNIKNIMFMFQGNNELIETTSSKRASMLRKLFGFEFSNIVDDFKVSLENIKNDSLRVSTQIEELKNRNFVYRQLKREIASSVIKSWEDEIDSLNTSLASIGDISSDTIVRNNNSINDVKRRIDSVSTTIDTTTRTLQSNRFQLEKYEKSVVGYNDEEFYLNEISTLDKDIESVTANLNEISVKLNDLRVKYGIMVNDLKNLEKQLKISRGGVCHSCGQPISEDHLVKLESEYKDKEEKSKELKESLSSEESNFSDVTKRKDMLKSNLSGYKTDLDTLRRDKNNVEIFKEKVKTGEDTIRTNKEYLTTLKDEEDRLQKEKVKLSEIAELVERKSDIEKQRDELKQRIKTAREVSVSNREMKKFNEDLRNEEDNRNKRLDNLNLEYNAILSGIKDIKDSIDIFDTKLPNFIIVRVCNELENYINQIVQRLFPEMRVYLKANKGGVNFFYSTGGEDSELVGISMASGAQKQVVTLAYQIALANMNNLDAIFLDEIDASMSPENSSIVFEYISSLSSFKQIVFISHRKESLEAVGNKDNLIMYNVENGEYTQI